MDDQNKNLILATVLSAAVIFVWYTFFTPPMPQPETVPADVVAAEQVTAPVVAEATAAPAPVSAATAPRIEIDTPRLKGSLSLAGGRIDDLLLRDYKQTLAADSPDVRLLAPIGGQDQTTPYYAVYGWQAAGGLDPELLPDARTIWSAPEGARLTVDTPITLSWDNGAGLVFNRTISVDADYMFTITQSVENNTGASVRLAPYGIIARHGIPDSQRIYVLHEGLVRGSDGKLQEIKYDDIPELDVVQGEGNADIVEVAQNGWIGFTDKYWMATLIPTPGQAFTSVVRYAASNDIYQAETRLPVTEVAPGATAEATTMLFAGAKEWETIKRYENDPGVLDKLSGINADPDRPKIAGFIDSIDWGWFFFLTKPMFWLLHLLHGLIGNMGWAIIALTLVIKTLVFPLARKSYISMAKMKELQPEMEKLKEAAGDDRQKLQQGMMALYKKEKVNPASGCLPIILQIPIFFSLYKVIYVTIELYHAPFVGWLRDLSAPDPTSILNLFGLLPWATPEQGSLLFMFSLGVLPILLGISMWFQQKLNPAPTDPAQAAIFAWMPWIFMFMLGSFASGLVLYWIANNTITFIQQYTIMTMHGKRPDIFGNIKAGIKRGQSGK
ncbi:membrane protein insertase YidC [Defluviimonas sp. WL0002]|uniref:Membrane protein insertase YidC n=1 Tax=Albidovulum marisflavi TaxID=2984159 RepID=A0ABT2ZEA9_9RHOB|nr:membrane protein insertase YidC [Defluviimonas sp. WL0002]MCV2869347.1 membrane protein insertase YidC [Defluviimonas sp. WL0002]